MIRPLASKAIALTALSQLQCTAHSSTPTSLSNGQKAHIVSSVYIPYEHEAGRRGKPKSRKVANPLPKRPIPGVIHWEQIALEQKLMNQQCLDGMPGLEAAEIVTYLDGSSPEFSQLVSLYLTQAQSDVPGNPNGILDYAQHAVTTMESALLASIYEAPDAINPRIYESVIPTHPRGPNFPRRWWPFGFHMGTFQFMGEKELDEKQIIYLKAYIRDRFRQHGIQLDFTEPAIDILRIHGPRKVRYQIWFPPAESCP